jgi:hypothetical protein
VGDERQRQEDHHRDRHRAEVALPPPAVGLLEAGDRPAARQQEGGTAEGRHAAQRDHERGHAQAGDGEALQPARGRADRQRRQQRQEPAVARGLGLGPHREAALQPALGDGGRRQPGQRHHRAHREVDAAGEDDEGHADREQAVDRDLPHDVEEVQRPQEARLEQREGGHQDEQEDQRRQLGQQAERVDPRPAAAIAARAGRPRPDLTLHHPPPQPARTMDRGSRPWSSTPRQAGTGASSGG